MQKPISETTDRPSFLQRWTRVIRQQPAWSREQLNNDFHLRCIEAALEDSQGILTGEAPEEGFTHEEAIGDTLDRVRDALLKHLPEIRKALQLT